MNNNEILKKAKALAKVFEKRRKDQRYKKTMGFLVAKGFLYTNQDITMIPNARIKIDDAIWAGRNVEPRILEVLPAAVMRLTKHFDYKPEKHIDLKVAIEKIKNGESGHFFGIGLEKIKPWLNINLSDGRTKKTVNKKVMKTFRLLPETVEKLKRLKVKSGQSEAEIIEKLVAGAGFEPTTFGL
jgi:hypothetical protein